MNTKLLLWAFTALAITTSAYAAEPMSDMHKGMEMGDKKMNDMHKGMDMGDNKKTGQEYSTKGKVVAVKPSGITVAHEPVPALKWPAMSMEFGLDSPNQAKDVKPGDTVSFQFVERNGRYVVTHLTKAK